MNMVLENRMKREEEASLEPMSPISQYMSTSNLTLSIIALMEIENPVHLDESQACSYFRDHLLPINPRFSSILVVNDKGERKWKKVEVNVKDHVKFPIFSSSSTELYDDSLNEYLTKISMEKFQENKPLWEIYIIKYPTKRAAGHIIFKLHHSLGDGFSLMATLLHGLRKADNPSLPLTFPSVQIHRVTEQNDKYKKILKIVPRVMSSIYYTVSDFCSIIGFSCGFFKDDISPVRSGHHGVEYLPTTTTTISFSIDSIKLIKNKLGVTLNDVVSGIISLGTRLYMEGMEKGSGKARATSLVPLNTRIFRGYKSIQEMLQPNSNVPWGNKSTFLHVPMPKMDSTHFKDPLEFVWKARTIIQRKRSSLGVFLAFKHFQLFGKVAGAETAAKYLHGTFKYASITITNMMGPIEKMALANHPVKGFYFLVAGAPQSLVIGVVSYNGTLRIGALMEKDFMDPEKFKLCIENAYDLIFEAACKS